jgi:hypothetical protein
MLEFARCMRDHGVDMPDPTFDGSGGGALIQKTDGAGAAGGGTGPGNATFDAAQKACQPIMDKAQQNAPKPTAEEQARMRDQMLAFTQCMRDHGIDMPDPTFDSDGGVSIQASGPGPSQDSTNGSDSSSSNGPSTGVGPNADPKFQAAAQACQQEGNGGPMFGVNGASSK